MMLVKLFQAQYVSIFLLILQTGIAQSVQWEGTWLSQACQGTNSKLCSCIPQYAVFSINQSNLEEEIQPIHLVEEEQLELWESEIGIEEQWTQIWNQGEFIAPIELQLFQNYNGSVNGKFSYSFGDYAFINHEKTVLQFTYITSQNISCQQEINKLGSELLTNPESGCWLHQTNCQSQQSQICQVCSCYTETINNEEVWCLSNVPNWVNDTWFILGVISSLCSIWVFIDTFRNHQISSGIIKNAVRFISIGDMLEASPEFSLIGRYCIIQTEITTFGLWLSAYWSFTLAFVIFQKLRGTQSFSETKYMDTCIKSTGVLAVLAFIPSMPFAPFELNEETCTFPPTEFSKIAYFVYNFILPTIMFVFTSCLYAIIYGKTSEMEVNLTRGDTKKLFLYPLGQVLSIFPMLYGDIPSFKWHSIGGVIIIALTNVGGIVDLILYYSLIRRGSASRERFESSVDLELESRRKEELKLALNIQLYLYFF